ncbi:MAG TPA: transferase [Methyloversatilis sp.]
MNEAEGNAPSSATTGRPVLAEDDGALTLYFDDSAIQSRMDPARPLDLVLDYSRIMMGTLLFVPEPRHIGMIGLGGGSLVKYCRDRLPDTRISVAEISPEVIALRERFHIPPDDDRLQVTCADGADWLAQQNEAFDLLFVDGFDIGGQAPALCTQRFYDDCRDALTGNGLLAINMHASDALHGAYVGRVRSSFANSVSVVATADGVNEIVFAAHGDSFRLSEKQLYMRACALERRLGIDLKWLARALTEGRRREFAAPARGTWRHASGAGE